MHEDTLCHPLVARTVQTTAEGTTIAWLTRHIHTSKICHVISALLLIEARNVISHYVTGMPIIHTHTPRQQPASQRCNNLCIVLPPSLHIKNTIIYQCSSAPPVFLYFASAGSVCSVPGLIFQHLLQHPRLLVL